MNITLFLHRLFNPHCSQCAELSREELVCNSCETLKQQLTEANWRERQLLDKLFPPPEELDRVVPEFVPPKTVSWAVKRQQLEEQDRIKMNMRKQEVEELEDEILSMDIVKES